VSPPFSPPKLGWTPRLRGQLRWAAAAVLVAVVGIAAGCGGDDDGGSGPPLDAAAERGRQVARDEGCTSCHTDDGDSGTWGETVSLEDGRTAVVDRDYLERSTRDPDADIVDGFSPLMPSHDLSDAEIDALAAYLEALADR
jgi:cytochrome c553